MKDIEGSFVCLEGEVLCTNLLCGSTFSCQSEQYPAYCMAKMKPVEEETCPC